MEVDNKVNYSGRASWGYTTPGQYNPPDAFYTEVPLTDDDIMVIGTIIGKQGFYFKAITKASRSKYIWFNPERKAVEIWGSENSLPHAVRRVWQRIMLVRNQQNAMRVLRAMGEAEADAAMSVETTTATSATPIRTPSIEDKIDAVTQTLEDFEMV